MGYNDHIGLFGALKGCPLRCVWCHSPESWSYDIEKYSNGETVGWRTTPEKVVEEVLRDKPFYDASGGGITLSGGEALAQPDFCREILRLSKAAGMHTAIETSGYALLKVVEAPQPPPEYGPAVVARLSRLTRKPVRLP